MVLLCCSNFRTPTVHAGLLKLYNNDNSNDNDDNNNINNNDL